MSGPYRPGVVKRPLRVLIVEDRDNDLLLLLHELDRAGYAVTHSRVETLPALRTALAEGDWELVLSDFSLPTMTAHDVLRTMKADRPELPCIVISGTIAEESAVDVLKAGARDFVVKERMARLVPAIERELRESMERRRLLAAESTLHETRERMQFALDAVGVGTWESDLLTGRTNWSEVLERLHGLAPGTFEGTFDAFIKRIHSDDRQAVVEQIERLQRDRSDCRLEYRTNWPDGSVHWILGMGRTFCDDQGRPVRAAGVGMDVTAQKRLEDQFRQAQKMESVGNLAGGVAHDFNNLLTVIAGCCDLTAPHVAPGSEAAESLEGIRAAAVSASALTRQLLTFSRRQVVVPRLLDLNETLTGFSKILRRLVEENVHIEIKLTPSLPLVSVDPGQIEQVLLNLVANARDAMPEGGNVTIETSTTMLNADKRPTPSEMPGGAYVVLSVSDTGSGMSKDVQSHLFEPFFTTKPLGRGTGLGLATVYGIVKQSEGHICVHSEPGSGTSFRIHLPAVSASSGTERADEKNEAITLTGSETILLVEDNAPLRRLTEKILQRHGYTVLVASNGAQAQQICVEHQGPIHVVFMDVIMPGKSGPAIGEWICQRRPDTKIIYTSGYTGDAVDRHGVFRPGNMFLQKPFNARQLTCAVRDVLSAHSSPSA
jgi:two-component system cell cycle sensor histidine kinase/response regulator CckA